jgi:hypothetical protein
MTTALAPTALPAGYVFTNGSNDARLHSHGFNWHETLIVVRYDVTSLGCARYIVRDRIGRRGYAFLPNH